MEEPNNHINWQGLNALSRALISRRKLVEELNRRKSPKILLITLIPVLYIISFYITRHVVMGSEVYNYSDYKNLLDGYGAKWKLGMMSYAKLYVFGIQISDSAYTALFIILIVCYVYLFFIGLKYWKNIFSFITSRLIP